MARTKPIAGWSQKPYGAFSPRASAGRTTAAKITQPALGGWGGRRYGSFSRDAQLTLSPQVAVLDLKLLGVEATLSFTGQATALSPTIPGTEGSLIFTGQDATLTEVSSGYSPRWGVYNFRERDRIWALYGLAGTVWNPASLTLDGGTATQDIGLLGAEGSLTFTGQNALLSSGAAATAVEGTLTLTGVDADLQSDLNGIAASLSTIGINATLSENLEAAPATLTFEGQDATFAISSGAVLQGVAGQLTFTTFNATLTATGVSRWVPRGRSGDVWHPRDRLS